MIHINRNAARIVARIWLPLALVVTPAAGHAQGQSGNGWFVPQQPQPTGPGAAAQPRGPQAAAGPRQPVRQDTPNGPPPSAEPSIPLGEPQGQLPPLQVQLPPMPEIPPVPKGSPTPASIIGILSVPDILRISTAYQAAYKELMTRRNRLAEDDRKEQSGQRELAQTFANERAKLTPEQIRGREKEYADRVGNWRTKYSERGQIIQEAYQYVMAQVERVIEVVAQQVAASRGVNLVLNRAQVLGTTADFDLTPQVAEIVNKVLPTVVIPPDGVSPAKINAPIAGPRASAAPESALPAKN